MDGAMPVLKAIGHGWTPKRHSRRRRQCQTAPTLACIERPSTQARPIYSSLRSRFWTFHNMRHVLRLACLDQVLLETENGCQVQPKRSMREALASRYPLVTPDS